MMRRGSHCELRRALSRLACGFMLTLLAGCVRQLPAISGVSRGVEPQILQQCEAIFPAGPWQATHIIEASLPLGNDTSLIGVVAAARNPSEFRAVLMTEEGIVLLDASYRSGAIEVHRAVPPVDPEGFGRAMVGDVNLLLFRPRGNLTQVGRLETGESVCRWRNGDESVDVIAVGGRVVRLMRFDSTSLVREVKIGPLDARGLPSEAWLETKGMIGYSLHLKLLDFVSGDVGTETP